MPRLQYRFGHAIHALVRLSTGLMVYIVELANTGIASRQHFAIGMQSNLIQSIGLQTLSFCIHSPTPCPESIMRRARTLGMTAQCTLKDVAVRIHKTREERYTWQPLGDLGGRFAFTHGMNRTIIGD